MMNPSLLVIDIINSCCSMECETDRIRFSRIRDMVPRLAKHIEEYKKRVGLPVYYINCTKWDREHLPSNINNLYKDPLCRYYSKDRTVFSEEFYLVKPGKEDYVFTKNTYDALTIPALMSRLGEERIDTLIVTGVFGDGCVHATIQGAFSKGYNLIMLKDLIETTDIPVRQKIQKLLKEYTWPVMFGKTIESKELWKIISRN